MAASAIFEGHRNFWPNWREQKDPLIHLGMAYYTPRATALFFFAIASICTAAHFTGDIVCISTIEDKQFVLESCKAQKRSSPIVTISHPEYHRSNFMYFNYAPMYLFVVSFSFIVVAAIWTALEGGLMRTITDGFRGEVPHDPEILKRKLEMVTYGLTCNTDNNLYHAKYVIGLVANLATAVVHLYLMCKFIFRFDENKLFYSFLQPTKIMEWLSENPEGRTDDLSYIFPYQWRCAINYYGPSGTLQHFSPLCTSSLNGKLEMLHVMSFYFLIAVGVGMLLDIPLYFATQHLFPHIVGRRSIKSLEKLNYSQRLVLFLFQKNVHVFVVHKLYDRVGCGSGDIEMATIADSSKTV